RFGEVAGRVGGTGVAEIEEAGELQAAVRVALAQNIVRLEVVVREDRTAAFNDEVSAVRKDRLEPLGEVFAAAKVAEPTDGVSEALLEILAVGLCRIDDALRAEGAVAVDGDGVKLA